MKRLLTPKFLCFYFACLLASSSWGQKVAELPSDFAPKVIYGEDDRLDYYQVDDPALRMLADSTAVMVQLNGIADTGSGYRFTSAEILADSGVCEEEPFYSQPTPGFCSAFLVSPDLVVTAGHCVNAFNVTNIAFVFGFQMENEDTPVTEFPYEKVYFGTELVAREGSTCSNDWSMVRLDRPVEGLDPLAVRREGKVPNNQELVVIGYPVGLPVKISGGANVRSNVGFRTFVANLDTYQGNSGSAVFNTDTLEVEGVLVCGETDFVFDSELGCRVSNRCPDDGCRGEDCTRATEWSGLLPDDPCAGKGNLAISSPKSGDSFPRGDAIEVSWDSIGEVGESVDLLLFRGEYFAGPSWSGLRSACGSINKATITIPGDLAIGSNYRLRIHNGGVGDAFISDFSPYFSVSRNPSEGTPEINILAPAASDTGLPGDLKEVSWMSDSEVGDEVRILLFKGEPENLAWQFVDVHVPNQEGENSFLWTIPLGLEKGDDYRIKILSPSTHASELSEPFSIIDPEGIRVSTPNSFSRGVIREELEIRWSSAPGLESDVEMLFFAGQTPVWQGIRIFGIPNQPGENVYRWVIPDSLRDTLLPGTPVYSIKIFQDEFNTDYSELFSIDRVPSMIEVVRPNTTDIWHTGENVQIDWNSSGEVRSELQLLLFRLIDGSLYWQLILEPLTNQLGSNSYIWTVPDGLVSSGDYVIKIYDPADQSLFDLSDPFTITSSSKGQWGPQELIEYLESGKSRKSEFGNGNSDLRVPLLWHP